MLYFNIEGCNLIEMNILEFIIGLKEFIKLRNKYDNKMELFELLYSCFLAQPTTDAIPNNSYIIFRFLQLRARAKHPVDLTDKNTIGTH